MTICAWYGERFDEVYEVKNKVISDTADAAAQVQAPLPLPAIVKQTPKSESAKSDIHRFWEQTGSFYAKGLGNDNITDPFIGLSVMSCGYFLV
ncbi:MAG: hypothetical protein R2795_05110 [Saprospiraceae bacterium]